MEFLVAFTADGHDNYEGDPGPGPQMTRGQYSLLVSFMKATRWFGALPGIFEGKHWFHNWVLRRTTDIDLIGAFDEHSLGTFLGMMQRLAVADRIPSLIQNVGDVLDLTLVATGKMSAEECISSSVAIAEFPEDTLARLRSWKIRRPPSSNPPHILVLHPFRGSPKLARLMFLPLLLKYDGKYTFLRGRKLDLPRPYFEVLGEDFMPTYSYASRTRDQNHFAHLDYDMQFLLEDIGGIVRNSGIPFDGIMGVSQGAMFGAIVMAAAERGVIDGQPAFKFGVLFNGSARGGNNRKKSDDVATALMRTQHPVLSNLMNKPICSPTYLIRGKEDMLANPSFHLYLKWFNPATSTVFEHPGGHWPFNSSIPKAAKLAAFICAFIDSHFQDDAKEDDERL